MIGTLVSARVPQAKKDAANEVLASLGATVSDLINAAFDYVITRHEMPKIESKQPPSPEKFKAFVDATTFAIDWETDEIDYKTLIGEGRLSDYEHLA